MPLRYVCWIGKTKNEKSEDWRAEHCHCVRLKNGNAVSTLDCCWQFLIDWIVVEGSAKVEAALHCALSSATNSSLFSPNLLTRRELLCGLQYSISLGWRWKGQRGLEIWLACWLLRCTLHSKKGFRSSAWTVAVSIFKIYSNVQMRKDIIQGDWDKFENESRALTFVPLRYVLGGEQLLHLAKLHEVSFECFFVWKLLQENQFSLS